MELDEELDANLITVISDLYLAEAGIQLDLVAEPDSMRAAALSDPGIQTRRDSVLSAHDLNEETFQAALAPYVNDPEELRKLYDRVLDHLSLERQQHRAQ